HVPIYEAPPQFQDALLGDGHHVSVLALSTEMTEDNAAVLVRRDAPSVIIVDNRDATVEYPGVLQLVVQRWKTLDWRIRLARPVHMHYTVHTTSPRRSASRNCPLEISARTARQRMKERPPWGPRRVLIAWHELHYTCPAATLFNCRMLPAPV